MTRGIVVVGALVEKDDKYLLVQELKRKCHLQWNLPLGRLVVGEKMREGALREVKEESGYDVRLIGLVDVCNNYNDDAVLMRFTYAGEIVGGNIDERLSDEISDVRWFSKQELQKMNEEGKLRGGDEILNSILQYEKEELLPADLIKDVKHK